MDTNFEKKKDKNLLITGGAGFIGSHVVRHFVKKYPRYEIYNLDALTYAGNLEHLGDIAHFENYHFIKGDVADASLVQELFHTHAIEGVIHLAAESHVDRSIADPFPFVRTNVMGTASLLEAARTHWKKMKNPCRFYHASTDEVYGPLGETGTCRESSPYRPQSPYAASKAGADHLVCAYANTHGIPFVVGCPSNNYGPCQFPEKLIPKAIANFMEKKPVPVYGKGLNIRDWLYVEDHVEALDRLFHRGAIGVRYNIGGGASLRNVEVLHRIVHHMEEKVPGLTGLRALIRHVADRKGHDYRYAMRTEKIRQSVGWKPLVSFETGLARTIDWYLSKRRAQEKPEAGSLYFARDL